MQRYVVEWHKEADANEKSADWYWVLGIIACAGIVVSFLFGNLLLATIIGLGAIIMMLLTHMEPTDTVCRLTHTDIAVNDTTYSLHDLEAYHIDEKDGELVLRFKTGQFLLPMVIVHIPEEYAEDIDAHFRAVVPAERIEEGLSHRVLEIFGI